MDLKKLSQRSQPKRLAGYVKRLAGQTPAHHHEGGAVSSTRTELHNGHKISIVTTYEVTVDGRKLDAPLSVDNEGRLSCHSLPNYVFASAVDAIKQIIDSFPAEFSGRRPAPGHHHPAHHAAARKKSATKSSRPAKKETKPRKKKRKL